MANDNLRKSKLWKKDEQKYAKYQERYVLRMMQLMQATQNLIEYYENAGDSREDAEIKVTLVSREVSRINGGAKVDYFLGDTGQLVQILNNIDETNFPHFDANAKLYITNDLQGIPNT
jgi:hypothetical protein